MAVGTVLLGGEAIDVPPEEVATRATWWVRLALAGIVAVACVLRLVLVNRVPPDPFYDAAVRTMGGSWHAFLVGALEPGARVSLDKPPIDLWLQVASTSIFGFGRVSLQLPIVLAGVASVVLVYDLVRMVAGRGAGLASALVLATLPIAVLTDRSDTMDGVMSTLLVLAAWLIVRAARSGRPWLLWAAGAAAGLAFEVKVVESLLAAPALAVLAVLAWPGSRRHLLGMGATFLVVALAWLGAVSLVPAGQRPWALGSTNGSPWDSTFVYNGIGRLTAAPPTTSPTIGAALTSRGPARLFGSKVPGLGTLIGFGLLATLLFGATALAAVRRETLRRDRLAMASLAALVVWLVCGFVVFSEMGHLHARYLAELAPAVAVGVGVSVVAAARAVGRRRSLAFACALAAAAVGAFALSGLHRLSAPRVGIVAALVALSFLLALGVVLRRVTWPWLAAACLAAAIAIPALHGVDIIRSSENDAGQAGLMSPGLQRRLSAFLIGHQGSASDEAAVESVYTAAAIVVHDGRPILMLDDENDGPLVSASALRAAVQRGQVRYAVLAPRCFRRPNRRRADCAVARWVRANGVNVTTAVAAPGTTGIRLYRLRRQ